LLVVTVDEVQQYLALGHEIRAFEVNEGISFAGIVMQDAEDVVHPLALRLFNYYVPDYDLVQTPVLSLRRSWWDITGGHYMEEFAEFHAKEMMVRERFAGVVPGSGVGTCYSRRALARADETGETFSTHSLTEDYEFSFRLRDAGLRMIFARVSVNRTEPATGISRWFRRERTTRDWIATREYFPSHFRAAFRQKSRWTIGIALQGWRTFGWSADWQIIYLFWRDRRGLVLAHVTALGGIAFAAFLGLEAFAALVPQAGRPAPLLPEDDPLWMVVNFNLGLLAHRMLQRHFWAWVHYGPGVLPMVAIRYFWASIVNYCALVRALRIWARHLRTGAPIGWDKTAHHFPIGSPLHASNNDLGDLLLADNLLLSERSSVTTGVGPERVLMDLVRQ